MTRSEQELASVVVGWLGEQGWDVYQEVTVRGGPRCDIVATQGPITWAIECKTSFGLGVLDQAFYWRGRANLVSVAVPYSHSDFGRRVAREYGIGILHVIAKSVREHERPRLWRRVEGKLRQILRDEHKTYAPAGNADASYFSPFKATCRNVSDFVRRNPGAPLKQVIDSIGHHYASTASARQHIRHWIEAGKIEGLALRREGRQVFVDLAIVESSP